MLILKKIYMMRLVHKQGNYCKEIYNQQKEILKAELNYKTELRRYKYLELYKNKKIDLDKYNYLSISLNTIQDFYLDMINKL